MTEQKQEKRKTAIRIGKRLRLAVIFGILVVIAVLVYRHIDYLSIDERLAAIEASRSIPGRLEETPKHGANGGTVPR